MKSKFFSGMLLITALIASCGKEDPVMDRVDFENLDPGATGYWNGSDLSGGFSAGNIDFVNHYNAQYQSWSGFAYTNSTDTVTKDYTNQYASVAGKGATGSEDYGVFYYSGVPDTMFFKVPEKITSFSFTNNVYSFYSMKRGDAFSKKFGGTNGTDPDWFKLTLTFINSENQVAGTSEIYLADFRFTEAMKDYIANAWTSIDFSVFGFVSAIKFEMSSSDTGQWGMNTPGYVCIDNITGILDVKPE
ncbi:MAG: DUF4465 domain-containing protein [Bacteroidales bacterium]